MPDPDRTPVVPALRARLQVGARVCKRLGYGPHQQASAILALALMAAAHAGVDVLEKGTEDALVEAGREAEKAIKLVAGQPVDPAAVALLLVESAALRLRDQRRAGEDAEHAVGEARWRAEEEASRAEAHAAARAREEAEAAEQLARQQAAQAEEERARIAAEDAARAQAGQHSADPLDELGAPQPAAKPPRKR